MKSNTQHVESQLQKIYKTEDYDIFKHSKKNRPYDNNLVASIKNKNMLHSHPMLVNDRMLIIDGQHRLEAARLLKLPVYYMIDKEAEEVHIPICQVQKSWSLEDFAHFYSHANLDYKYVYDIGKKFKLSTAFIMNACASKYSNYKPFRVGKYKIEYHYSFLDQKFFELNELMDVIKPIINKKVLQNTLRALWKIIFKKEYDHNHFLNKIDIYPSHVIRGLKLQSMLEIYEALVDNVYNRNTKDPKKKMKREKKMTRLIKCKKNYDQYEFQVM